MNTLNSINIKALSTPIDNATDSIISFKRGDDISFRVAIFKDDETLASLDDILSLHFEIYNIGNYQSPSPRTFETLLQKTIDIADINTSLSLDDWNNEISQHAIFELAPEESTLEYGEKWLRISAKTQDFKYLTLSAGWIEVEENYSTYEIASIEDVQTWKNAAQESAEEAQAILEEIQTEIAQIESLQNDTATALEQAEVSASAAQSSATSASASATAAQSSATSASASATSASASATSASSSASSATTSASTASSAATQTASNLAEIQTLKTEILGTSIEDLTSTSITIAQVSANTIYNYGTLTSLTLSSIEDSKYEARIFFSSGDSSTAFTYPDTLNTIGDVYISSNKSYAISICNNIMVVGELN